MNPIQNTVKYPNEFGNIIGCIQYHVPQSNSSGGLRRCHRHFP